MFDGCLCPFKNALDAGAAVASVSVDLVFVRPLGVLKGIRYLTHATS